ncbi:alpha/beta hydrolase [Sinomonas atrocyanea]|jgi:pimeloyl-ACP methyl ester carboxylesterase|uniref:alpha/beta fold hydrolase n=1 Tax=Sinomonas atrocyanea TaxID=37927 RepID=UPI002862CC30|nr:alpha/beta hydrolase [Sinomonas atrocyanea]MDR6621454.1 pimeloyl-ACP methyl ester carboxylesterase [Sinomonas atrocyanea]
MGVLQLTSSTVATKDGASLELFTAPEGGMTARGGIVVVHGSMVTAELYKDLAVRLAEELHVPVHVYNRRGRGASSPQPADYSLATEVSDLGDVLAHTGSDAVFGHNYGGCIALHAGRELQIGQIAVYDPIISFEGSIKAGWMPEFEEALRAKDEEKALAVLLRGLQTAGPISKLPLPVLTVLNRIGSRTPLGKELSRLLPTGPAEIRAVVAADAEAKGFDELPLETLFLVGGASPEYFAEAAQKLDGVLPASDIAILPKLAHDAPTRPAKPLIDRLAAFFAS